jgi:lipopolysaccharide/colanic/teichoic acid biosynthesis glycosyltransferase/glycosyltransferase involved in cell wall biosynthesis
MTQPVAIVHDWLMSMRGSERVVEAFCKVFPQADLFTLTWDPTKLSPALSTRRATTSAIHKVAKAPFVNGRFRAMLPFFPLAVESFKLDPYALVVSSSHCVAMGALAPPSALHVAYVHSTLRYVHEAQPTYEASVPMGSIGRALFRGTAHYLRRWEFAAAARPDVLIANSTYTRDRILRYYRRDALVIEPPIETRRFEDAASGVAVPSQDAPFLMVSALVPNKRVDLAIRAFQGRPERLVIVGEGPERARLEPLVGPNVTLSPRVGEGELAGLFASCRALLHTGVDDFGMVMVEALAAGRPVLACAEGGALEIVREGETGMLIEVPTVEAVRATLDRFASRATAFDPSVLRAFAKRFDTDLFERRFAAVVEEAWRKHHDAARNGNGAPKRAHWISMQQPPVRATENGVGAVHSGSVRSRLEDGGELRRARECVAAFSPGALAAKRCFDFAVSAAGLVLTAPLMGAMAAWIRLDSRGPALFYQTRPGRYQRPFTLVKLRTMNARGEVTRAGRWLRPLGLDELPQLWNVLRGDMSLVGPRPEVLERVALFEKRLRGYHTRHLVRPGITGWAQVNGMRGNKAPIGERFRLDIEYLRNWSLALDGRVLLRTLPAVLVDTLSSLRG